MSADGVEYKLAKKQLQAIEFNKALLAMYTNQVHTDFSFGACKLHAGLTSVNTSASLSSA